MTDKPDNHIILGKLVHAFIRAGWNPPPPSTRIVRHILEDMADGRDPMRGDVSIHNATLDLSPQQRAVLTLTAMGMAGPEAAEAMDISHETVRWHLKATRDRLGARNTAHAVAIALREEIIELPGGPSPKHAQERRDGASVALRRPSFAGRDAGAAIREAR
jgi:DNA-binding CsgD family transcriptional regulator